MSFVVEHDLWSDEQQRAAAELVQRLHQSDIELVRFAWCDLHGIVRGKTLVVSEAVKALRNGVRMVGTLLLKDSAYRTAFPVFSAGGGQALQALEGAADVVMAADPLSFQVLPWADKTGWIQCEAFLPDGSQTGLEPRQILRKALSKLKHAGYDYVSGLEVEFHIYQLSGERFAADPQRAAWPPEAPAVQMVHPGHNLLTEQMMDLADAPLRIVQKTAQALGLPLTSLEIELGPSQVEAVFAPRLGLQSADDMLRFRNGVKQALRRAGYHATFMCRPRFANVMSSGWHLHQSLLSADGSNAFTPAEAAPGDRLQAATHLSPIGQHFLAGLLQHASACTALATPTLNGYGRYQPHTLAPQHIIWGPDNRGALLRVVGNAQDASTRIENRMGEPAANPYLYLASQIYAGLDGITRQLAPPRAVNTPYATDAAKLPTTLGAALDALQANTTMSQALGQHFVDHFCHIKRFEIERAAKAPDAAEWEQREYFNLF
jgi:glutamine synthetase